MPARKTVAPRKGKASGTTGATRSATKSAPSRRSTKSQPAANPRKSASKTSSATKQSKASKGAKAAPKSAGGARAANKEATQKRILKAALELFDSKGYDNTTTSAIAKRAGIAEGTVFNYFETKDDIVLYFLELEVDEAIRAVRSRPQLRNAPLEEKLFALIERQLGYLAPYKRFIGAAFLQALRPASKLAVSVRALSLRQRYIAFVEELMRESLPTNGLNIYAWIAPQVFYLYYIGVLLFWLNDASENKQATLAFLDRSLAIGVAALRKGSLP